LSVKDLVSIPVLVTPEELDICRKIAAELATDDATPEGAVLPSDDVAYLAKFALGKFMREFILMQRKNAKKVSSGNFRK
jgi:hypothetical protein